jgi:AsmA protein
MKVLKYALIAVAGVAVLVAGVLAYIAATFDPNAYKPQVIQLVKDKKQRLLRLDGDIKLAFWPNLGAEVDRLSLSEFKSDKEFAAIESARASLALMPLLSKQVVVNEVTLKGVRANIVRFKDGRTNIDDLLAKEDQKQQEQVKFDIDHVAIENAALNFRDEAKGAQYALSKFNLKTGRIANGVPTKIELSLAVQGNQPRLNLVTELKTRLTFDLDKQTYALEDLALEAKGQAADIQDLAAKASGSVTAKLKTNEFAADKLAVAVTGMSGKDKLDVKVDAPKLSFTSDRASGDKVTVTAKISGPDGATSANLSLPGIEGTAQAFKSSAMVLELEIKRGEQTVKTKISSPVSGNIQAQQLSLPQLKASISAGGSGLLAKSINGELAGSTSLDGAKQNLQANLAGKVADSNVKARIAMNGFASPVINFELDIDQLDVDRYLPPQPAAAKGAAGGASKQPEKPFDLSGLRNLRANGTLRIGSLKIANVKASNVKLDIKAAGGRVDVNPIAANLYQGTLNGTAAVNAAPATPTFAVKQNLSGVNIGPLLKDLADHDTLEGRGTVSLDVVSQGNSTTALKKSLSGNAATRIVDGAVKGIDIAGSIRNAKARLGALKGEQVQQADSKQKTDFSELTATFNIKNGVAHNNDLSIKSPLLRIGGEGDVNIGEDSINYLVKASIVGTLQGQGGRGLDDLRGMTVPVRVTGLLTAPSYKLDFNAMVTDAAKQKVEQTIKEKLQERLGGGTAKDGKKDSTQGGGGLGDTLKGLFGR